MFIFSFSSRKNTDTNIHRRKFPDKLMGTILQSPTFSSNINVDASSTFPCSGPSVTRELYFPKRLCRLVGRGKTQCHPRSNNTLKFTEIQSWSFFILSLAHRWEEGTQSQGSGKGGRGKEERKGCLPRPTVHEQDFPWSPEARPSRGKVARAHTCHGHEQLTKILPPATSHKAKAALGALRSVRFHFTPPGLLEDTFVPRGLISEGCRCVATWTLTRIWICKLYSKTMDTCSS